MEVAEGIHRIETPFGDRVNAVYLLVGPRATMLVDTATRDTAGRIGSYLDEHGLPREDVRYVLNTHCDWDHAAGNGVVRELLPRATFCCHELDRPMIEDVELLIGERYGEFARPHGYDETEESKAAVRAGTLTTPIDIGLSGGEVVDLGGGRRVAVLHTPGHSRGSISVYDPRSRSAIIGDAVLGEAVPMAVGAPAFPPTYRYVDSYLGSIDLLRQLAPRALLTGHYPVYVDGAVAEFLLGSRNYVDRVDRAVRDHLAGAGGPVSMAALIGAVNGVLGHWPDAAAPALHFPLSGHLERLVSHRLVSAAPAAGGRVEYAWLGTP
jgi:glyoxylase-like metal-dependent hydrolase (beta-lactamase superfamily II)